MVWLVLGLVVFLGIHSLRIAAPDVRSRAIARFGEATWKGIYALIALVGLVSIVWGFGLARQTPTLLYTPPMWLRHLNALFALVGLILVAAAYVPRSHFRAWFGHPMLAGVAIWALGHLLATGFVHDVVLFGAFFGWSLIAFVACRRRDRASGIAHRRGLLTSDMAALVIGTVLWALFAFHAHEWLIGRSPLL